MCMRGFKSYSDNMVWPGMEISCRTCSKLECEFNGELRHQFKRKTSNPNFSTSCFKPYNRQLHQCSNCKFIEHEGLGGPDYRRYCSIKMSQAAPYPCIFGPDPHVCVPKIFESHRAIVYNYTISSQMIQEASGIVFVFGDNLEKYGMGGQAKIARPFVSCGKAIGIPTKRKPSMDEGSFFADRDDEITAVRQVIHEIDVMLQDINIVFFPNIGMGLAELDVRSPIIHKILVDYTNNITKMGLQN